MAIHLSAARSQMLGVLKARAVQESMDVLLTTPGDHAATARIAEHFSLDQVAVGALSMQLKLLKSYLRPEVLKQDNEVLYRFFTEHRGQSGMIVSLAMFLTVDWQQVPHKKVQSLAEVLDLGIGSVTIFEKLGLDPVVVYEHRVLGGVAEDLSTASPPIVRQRIAESDYFLEVVPGTSENYGGLKFRIVLADHTPLLNIGALFGTEDVTVVTIQGGGKDYSAHHRKVIETIGKADPFDWLIESVALWARSEGFSRIRGYGYALNSWIQKHLEDGDIPESRRDHFERMYDKRFVRLGMRAKANSPDVYERLLLPLMSKTHNSEVDRTLLTAMEEATSSQVVMLDY